MSLKERKMDMRCGFYEREITPPLGCDMPGYYIPRPANAVEDKLYAKAAVFADDSNDPRKMTALLVVDMISVSNSMRTAIVERASAATGIPEDQIALIATHSHYSLPAGDYGSPRDDAYMKVFHRLAADTVTLAWQRLAPCSLRYGLGRLEGEAFVRDCVLDDGAVVTNPVKFRDRVVRTYTESDPDLPVLTVCDAEGNTKGVLYTFALHCDTVGLQAYSGDFPSEVSKQVKNALGSDAVSIFLPGFCGDINHIDFLGDTTRDHRSIGKSLAKALLDTSRDSGSVEGDSLELSARWIPLNRRRPTPEEVARMAYVAEDPKNRKNPYNMLGSRSASIFLDYQQKSQDLPDAVPVLLQVLRLGDVWLYICPYEMYSAFAKPLKEASPSGKWLISEMANVDSSYVPTAELFGTDAYPCFLCEGSWLEIDAGDKLVENFLDMVKKM